MANEISKLRKTRLYTKHKVA